MPPPSDQSLLTTTGCAGVFNPDQLLDYHIQINPADWSALLADTTYKTYYPAQFRCGNERAIAVGIRRKRSGGTRKPGLKVDINAFVAGQRYFDLTKLSFEIGASSGGGAEAEVKEIVAEYLSNRMMFLSGAHASRASLARLHLNDAVLGVYANVEQIDKRFLKARLGENAGWLYQKSGGVGDGWQTNEGVPDPYDMYFCFWRTNGCAVPSMTELVATLPGRLNIDQFLRVGAVNALLANTDGPLFKDNNYLFYDHAGGRLYFAWDLDTTMKDSQFNVFTGGGRGGSPFVSVLFPHWEGDYDRILTDLLKGPLALAVIQAELDRASRIAGAALDGDPVAEGKPAADAIARLKSWWSTRHAQGQAQVAAH